MLSVKKVGGKYRATNFTFVIDQILEKIKEAGFNVSLTKETCLTKEIAEQFYSEHKDKEFFGDLTDFMSRSVKLLVAV